MAFERKCSKRQVHSETEVGGAWETEKARRRGEDLYFLLVSIYVFLKKGEKTCLTYLDNIVSYALVLNII